MATNLTLNARLLPPLDPRPREPYKANYEAVPVDPRTVGLILIDLWDKHWCPSMTKRGDLLAKQVAVVVRTARSLGCTVVHAPSECSDFYKGNPCRKLFLDGRKLERDTYGYQHLDAFQPPLRQDECEDADRSPHREWTRENKLISMEVPDIVVEQDESGMLLDYLRTHHIDHLVYAGAATNECVLYTRNTSIHTMQTWARKRHPGLRFYLARDLTDTMYVPPAGAPNREVHDSGTAGTVAWIERNLRVPSILSSDLLTAS